MLAAAMTQATDADAIDAARTAAGYRPPLGGDTVTEHRGDTVIEHRVIAAAPGDRAELNAEVRPARKSFRRQRVSPASIGQQSDSNGRRIARAAMRKVVQVIGGMHY